MPTPIKFSKQHAEQILRTRLVFKDRAGNYQRPTNEDRLRVITHGEVNGRNLFHTNSFAIQVEYELDGNLIVECPDFYDLDEIEAEEIEQLNKDLIRLRATRQIYSRANSTATLEEIVEVETNGIATCSRLDELDPIYEVETSEMRGRTGQYFFSSGLMSSESTSRKKIRRVF